MSNKKINTENKSFEELMARIDEISERLGAENISLEEALSLYEEGVALVGACNEKLAVAERKIKMLKISGDGEISEQTVS